MRSFLWNCRFSGSSPLHDTFNVFYRSPMPKSDLWIDLIDGNWKESTVNMNVTVVHLSFLVLILWWIVNESPCHTSGVFHFQYSVRVFGCCSMNIPFTIHNNCHLPILRAVNVGKEGATIHFYETTMTGWEVNLMNNSKKFHNGKF